MEPWGPGWGRGASAGGPGALVGALKLPLWTPWVRPQGPGWRPRASPGGSGELVEALELEVPRVDKAYDFFHLGSLIGGALNLLQRWEVVIVTETSSSGRLSARSFCNVLSRLLLWRREPTSRFSFRSSSSECRSLPHQHCARACANIGRVADDLPP